MGVRNRLRGAVQALLGADPQDAKVAVERARAKASVEAQERERRDRERELELKRLIRIARREQAELEASRVRPADGREAVLDYAPQQIRLLVSSDIERASRAHACEREPWTVAWIESSLRDGGVLYDIGANVGAFTLVAAKVCGARGRVVAFEPGYASFARLCDNIVLNGCQDLVLPLPIALGGATGLGTFRYRTLNPGESQHEFTDTEWTATGAEASPHYHQPVLSMRLDDVVAQFQVPRPTHMKIDVDGAELKVLSGAEATLREPALRSLLVEVDHTLTDAVPDRLRALGFELTARHERLPRKPKHVWYGVFERRARA